MNRTGILKFNLADIESELAFHRAVNANDAYGALWNVSQMLRDIRKHGEEPRATVAEEIEKKFYEILNDEGINLDRDWS